MLTEVSTVTVTGEHSLSQVGTCSLTNIGNRTVQTMIVLVDGWSMVVGYVT